MFQFYYGPEIVVYLHWLDKLEGSETCQTFMAISGGNGGTSNVTSTERRPVNSTTIEGSYFLLSLKEFLPNRIGRRSNSDVVVKKSVSSVPATFD